VRVYRFDGSSLTELYRTTNATCALLVSWSPDSSYLAAGLYVSNSGVRVYRLWDPVGIIFGDSSIPNGDLDVRVLAGAHVLLDGKIEIDE